MIVTNLDSIVRDALFEHNLPMHWYAEFLHYALNCRKELELDNLKTFKSVRLTVNAYSAVTLPSDFVDVIPNRGVATESGQYIQPLTEMTTFNRLVNDESGGEYGDIYNSTFDAYYTGFYHSSHITADGEYKGRWFGAGNGIARDGYQVIRERGEIQLDVNFNAGDEVVLTYIYRDTTATTITVHPYAEQTIKNYIAWKHATRQAGYNRFDVRELKNEYIASERNLRRRLSDLTVANVKASIRRGYNQGPKL